MSVTIAVRFKSCQRCGQDHEALAFEPLANPVDAFTHWGTCPETKQPVLLKFEDDAKDAMSVWRRATGFCDCGDPAAAAELVRDVLSAIDDWNWERTAREQCEARLKELLPTPGLYWFMFYWLDARGFTEHSGNVSDGRLDPEGSALLEALRKKIPDPLSEDE